MTPADLLTALHHPQRTWRRFRAWQRQPYRYDPMPEPAPQYECVNCGMSYDGHFCPRCGQAGLTRRLTMRGAISSALDVWGMGGKSLPRNMLHLLLRPGYMVADFIRGHRQPYFPPFKMLFLMAAFLTITIHVARLAFPEPPEAARTEQTRQTPPDTTPKKPEAKQMSAISKAAAEAQAEVQQEAIDWRHTRLVRLATATIRTLDNNAAMSALAATMIMAWLCTIFFRHSPRLPKLCYSENFYAHVMFQSQVLLINIPYFLLSLLWKPGGDDGLGLIAVGAIYYLDYRQLYGYGRRATLWRMFLIGIAFFGLALVAVTVFTVLASVEAAITK